MSKNQSTDKYIMNLNLAAYTGLYQLVNPRSPKIFGYNAYHVCALTYITFICILLVLILVGFYYWIHDLIQIVSGVLLFLNYLFACYKAIVVIQKSNNIWECIDITRIDFMTSYEKYNPNKLKKCIVRCSVLTYAYSIFCYVLLIVWYLIPLALTNFHMVIKQRDGTYWKYRVNVHNMYFTVSEKTYNEYFLYFYVIEVVFGLCYIMFSVIFENFLISVTFAFSSQIETISNAFESLGSKPSTTRSSINENYKNMKYSNELLLNNLRMITKDYQSVLKKLHDFYKIVRPVILFQLAVDSSSLIFLSFIVTLNIFHKKDFTKPVQSLKMFSAIPVCIFNLFTTCYLFGNINDQINSVNIHIFNSNWTEMDFQFKKIILLKMLVNNTNKMQFKITPLMAVNMEMFLNVMRTCYSILSVIVNYNLSSVD